MLIEFSIGNYRSFSDIQTLTMEATAIKEYPDNVFTAGKYQLLSRAAVYGANASGKSNLITGLNLMKAIVLEMLHQPSTAKINYQPFALDIETQNKPTHFEVICLIEGITYRYGFEYKTDKIVSEWLYETENKKEKALFLRIEDGIEVKTGFKEGRNLEEKTRDNVLFLSIVDQFNGAKAKKIMKWFEEVVIIDGTNHFMLRNYTIELLNNQNLQDKLIELYQLFDLGFDTIKVEAEEVINPNSVLSHSKNISIKQLVTKLHTYHKVIANENNKEESYIKFDLNTQESAGTNKIVDLSSALFAILDLGKILIIDELDAKLHPLLTRTIAYLFQDKEINTKGAQLIFTTHDTNLLNIGEFRRDQIYFTEKNKAEATELVSLVSYKFEEAEIGNGQWIEEQYMQRRYGGVPYLGNLSKLKELWRTNEK